MSSSVLKLIIGIAHAQELIPCPDGSQADSTIGCTTIPANILNPSADILKLILKTADGLLMILTGIAVIFLMYSAIRYAMAAGNDDQINKAKRAMFWSVFGLAISSISIFVVQFIMDIMK